MIGAELWRRRFDGDPGILGKTVTLAATPYTIVGVLPAGFQFPSPDVDVWIARPTDGNPNPVLSPVLGVFGRLNPGVDLEQATAELAVLNQHYRTAHPGMLDGKPNTVEQVTPLRDRLVAERAFHAVDALRRGRVCPADRVRQCRESAAGARGLPFAGIRGACGYRRFPRPADPATAGRERGAGSRRRGAGRVVGPMEFDRGSRIWWPWTCLAPGRFVWMEWCSVSPCCSRSATGVLFGLVPSLGASRPDLVAVLRASGEAASSTGKKRLALGLERAGRAGDRTSGAVDGVADRRGASDAKPGSPGWRQSGIQPLASSHHAHLPAAGAL